jgi:hypothetical protein
MKSHKKITQALAILDVEIGCKLAMCNIYLMLIKMYETDEENGRDVAQQNELERHSEVRTDVILVRSLTIGNTTAHIQQCYCSQNIFSCSTART